MPWKAGTSSRKCQVPIKGEERKAVAAGGETGRAQGQMHLCSKTSAVQ